MNRRNSFVEQHPWTLPWYRAKGESRWVLAYLIVAHVMAGIGLVLYPLPGWNVFWTALTFACLGSLGTTLGYHRGMAHRSVRLNPILEQLLIFFAVFNGSGSPMTWIANHRNHHANSDTLDDVSSPRHGGFWWAHIRWLYQWEPSPVSRWANDMMKPQYMIWAKLQIILVAISLTFGYLLFGWPGMLWIGAIRMVYCLHMQCFVNSLLHLKPGTPQGFESSQNIWWLGPLQITAWGENWHGNHHASPGSARFGRHWWQIDIAWYVICFLKATRLAKNVKHR